MRQKYLPFIPFPLSLSLSPPPFSSSGKITTTVGKTLAYTSIRFLNSRNELVARGSHTKYVAAAWKDEGNRVEEVAREREKEREGREGGGKGG